MKQLIKKYGHIWIMSYGILYLTWFAKLQANVGKPYHVIHTPLDDMIPFCEYFIIPYLMWFLYVAVAVTYFFFNSKDDYYRICTFLFTGMTISLLVCTLYPNGTNFRPHIDPDQNIFCYLVTKLWSIDPCINVFPSIHVYNSIGVHLAVTKSEKLSKSRPIVWSSGILMILICLSTVFLKQHSVVDVVGSLMMASVISPIVYTPAAARRRKYSEEYYRI
ncbi:MAG: phosphatase PAP2 family protein [Lachnospiraceae bacterium]|nr:phosphatase PAP2 family protein [Lachnospiraceae bacterium]